MKRFVFILTCFFILFSVAFSSFGEEQSKGSWITSPNFQAGANQWYCLRKTVELQEKPQSAVVKIAADSKYWLWINEKLVIYEGQLKRGPNPNDTYYDEIDLAPWLKKGKNTFAVLLWYYGKEGFSHKDSKKAGFFMEGRADGQVLGSDSSWRIIRNQAYQSADAPQTNFRLPESSVKYIASRDMGPWQKRDYDDSSWQQAQEVGAPPIAPWNHLVKRPIPFFKDFGLKKIASLEKKGNRVIAKLPYNMQFHFWIKVKAEAGKTIKVSTENFYNLNDVMARAEYETKEGVQEYEHYPWLNGHEIYFDVEEGVEILEVGYRETGYDASFEGQFTCEDPFLMKLSEKALRTLYVTMRDTYMDCPDRERAQWWGDLVLEMEESFYALDTGANVLARKAIYELVDWQRADSVLFSPIPAGNWSKELPQQMLASIGWYGFRNFVLYTGEKEIYSKVFPHVKRYLELWKVEESGYVPFKSGGWNWSDWGENIDGVLLEQGWYYLALKAYAEMADYVGEPQEKRKALRQMDAIKNYVNAHFWTPEGYRSSDYSGEIDDRGNALMVLAIIAEKDKFSTLSNLLDRVRHSSPYMEKYVQEALFTMGRGDLALKRMKERYDPMVTSDFSTLWEVFSEGNWSHNHAWSGGLLTMMYKYMAGIAPEEAGYDSFHVFPDPQGLTRFSCRVPTVKGYIKMSYEEKKGKTKLVVKVPKGSRAKVRIPITAKDYYFRAPLGCGPDSKVAVGQDDEYRYYMLGEGSWKVLYCCEGNK